MRNPTPKSARPDNAESKLDARTDIWRSGCLLNGSASLVGRYRHVGAVGDLLHFQVRNSRWDALRACAPARHHRIGTAARSTFEETR
jgi:hypothetical protein